MLNNELRYLSIDSGHGPSNSSNTKHYDWYDETDNLYERHPVCEERPTTQITQTIFSIIVLCLLEDYWIEL